MTTAVSTAQATDQTLAHLEQTARQRLDQGPDWLRPVRERALERLTEIGLPHKKQEEWRYSDPSPITTTRFTPAPADAKVTPADLARFAIPDLDAHRFVFVNGHHATEHQQLGDLPPGVTVCTLAEALENHRELVEPHLDAPGEASSEALTRLNAALCDDGLFVHVPDGKEIQKPIHVLNIATDVAGDEPTMTHPRNIVIVGEQAKATVIEHYVSLTDARYFNNAVTQLDVAREGAAHHYLIERESPAAHQLSTLIIDQKDDSDVHSHTVLIGGDWVRNNINPRINGENCHCLINGLYLARNKQHLDNHMRVEHNKAHGDSRQFYKGVLQDQAHTVFSGRIYVEKGAQKTDAKQHNSALLLSRDANAIGKPQLEIHADDVKCTHGATSGEIDDNALFYLTARGIDRETAHGMLVYAFAAESFERMELEPVRDMLAGVLLEWLPGGERLKAIL